MSNVPEGAQLSDDGQWYWDGSAWQAVTGGAAASGSGSAQPASGAAPMDERTQARVAAGLPATPGEETDEQRKAHASQPEFGDQDVNAEQVEVVAMTEHSDGGSVA